MGTGNTENGILPFARFDFGFVRTTSMPVLSTPRSPDLAHLRTALWFHEQERLTRFVTLDESQILAAAEIGLPA